MKANNPLNLINQLSLLQRDYCQTRKDTKNYITESEPNTKSIHTIGVTTN